MLYHSHKNWKHRLNWPVYVLVLRTKKHWSPLFFNGHQNVNKPKSGLVQTLYGPTFLLFLCTLSGFFFFFFFFFFFSRFKHAVIKMCHKRLRFVKEMLISTISNTWLRAKLHIDHKILFCYFLGATYTIIWLEAFKYYRAS